MCLCTCRCKRKQFRIESSHLCTPFRISPVHCGMIIDIFVAVLLHMLVHMHVRVCQCAAALIQNVCGRYGSHLSIYIYIYLSLQKYGTNLFTCSYDNTIHIHDSQNGKLHQSLQYHKKTVTCLEVSHMQLTICI